MHRLQMTTRSLCSLFLLVLLAVGLEAAQFPPVYAAATAGRVVGWGDNTSGQSTVPSDLSSATAIAAGGAHSLALKNDGAIVAWGNNDYGQSTVPAGLAHVFAISAGYYHSLALKSDGTIVAWGLNNRGQSTVPAGLSNVIAIAAGGYHNLALKSDGTVMAWGSNVYGQAVVPAGLSNVIAIAAGLYHSMALMNDGTVAAWGDSLGASLPANLSNVTAIAAGHYYSLALKSDGTVVSWGSNEYGQSTVPPDLSNVTAISAGGVHSLALKDDGVIVAWGNNIYGQTIVSIGLSNVTAIAAGAMHNLAITVADATPPVIDPPTIVGTLGRNGWYKSDVVVSWTVSDPESSVVTTCSPTTINTDTAGVVVTCNATSAGGDSMQTVTIRRDAMPPVITVSVAPAPSADGWNTTDVTVSYTCADALSGLAPGDCPANQVISGEGGALVSTIQTVVDLAGNSSTTSAVMVNIDRTPPSISAAVATPPSANGWYNGDVTVRFTCADNVSGVKTCPPDQILSGEGSAISSTPQTAVDFAGISSTPSDVVTVRIDKTPPVVTVNGVSDGTSYPYGTVPLAGCSTDDGISGVATPAVPVVAGGDANGIGALTATCSSAIDNARNGAAPVSVTYTVLPPSDTMAPVSVPSIDGTPGTNGWYTSNVTLNWNWTDSGLGATGIDSVRCQGSSMTDTEGAEVTVSSDCYDLAGNRATNFVTLKIDKTAPLMAVTGVSDGASYSIGSVPVAGCDTSDALSGLATAAVLNITGGNPDGSGSFTVSCGGAADNAGNSAAPVAVAYLVTRDATPPVITPSVEGTLGSNGWYVSDVGLGWSVVDAESEVASKAGCEAQTVSTDTDGVTFTCSATSAGSSASKSVTIKRDAAAPVFGACPAAGPLTLNSGMQPAGPIAVDAGVSGLSAGILSGSVDTSSVGTKDITFSATDQAGNNAVKTCSYNVAYVFTGFFQPVDNTPVLNRVKAGQSIPVKFSIGGNQGLDVLAAGSPTSTPSSCPGAGVVDQVEETTTSNSGLTYDAATGQYTYVWKTQKAWAGTCRQFNLTLADGMVRSATFNFTR